MADTPTTPHRDADWILYDGACGFCSWWVRFWLDTLTKAGYKIAPLQAKWVRERVNIPQETLVNDLRILRADNTLVNGAEVYLMVMKKIWWAALFGYGFSLPGIHWLFAKCYKVFNRNRFRVSRLCRLTPEMKRRSSASSHPRGD